MEFSITRPMLDPSPERTPPLTWRVVAVPLIMALVGIFVGTLCANVGQAEKRRQAYARLERLHEAATQELASATNEAEIDAARNKMGMTLPDPRRIWYQVRPGKAFTRWDGFRYEEIVDEGYLYHMPWDSAEIKENSNIRRPLWPESRSKNVVWYPLYPVLGYIAKVSTGLETTDALTLVSWTCVLAGAVVFFLVARRHYYNHIAATVTDESTGWAGYDNASMWALAFLLFGPAAVFLYSNYTESPFILLLGLFLLFLQKRNWWAAAVVAGIASACRSQGVLFGPILALVYLLRAPESALLKRLSVAFVLGCISAIGIGC